MKPTSAVNHKTATALQLDPRVCGYCANRFRDVHGPCSAEGVYRPFAPELMGRWEDLPDPVSYAEILTLPAQVVRALYYRDIWYLVQKIRGMEGYFE